MKDRILITVCGRAGSKGFKNKNLKSMFGVPLVHYTLASAAYFRAHVENAEVDICINTDSGELVALARRVEPDIAVIERPEALCGGTVGKFEVFKHSLAEMEKRTGKTYDYLIDMDITSPLRCLTDALGAFEALRARPDAEMTITGCRSRRNPYFNMVEEKGAFVKKVIDLAVTARQMAPAVYDMNASIYVLRRAFVADPAQHLILDAKSIIFEMEDTAVLDIDSEEDFELMQVIAAYLFEKREAFAEMFRTVKQYSK